MPLPAPRRPTKSLRLVQGEFPFHIEMAKPPKSFRAMRYMHPDMLSPRQRAWIGPGFARFFTNHAGSIYGVQSIRPRNSKLVDQRATIFHINLSSKKKEAVAEADFAFDSVRKSVHIENVRDTRYRTVEEILSRPEKGEQLFRACLEAASLEAQSRGWSKVTLDAVNLRLKAYYEGFGFRFLRRSDKNFYEMELRTGEHLHSAFFHSGPSSFKLIRGGK